MRSWFFVGLACLIWVWRNFVTAGQAAFTNPLKDMPHEPLSALQKPLIPVGDTINTT
jgi:hypothetical protein